MATACRFDVTLDLSLKTDGSGNAEVTLVTDAEFEDNFRLLGSTFEDFLAERGADVGMRFSSFGGDDGTVTYVGRSAKPSAEGVEGLIVGLVPGIGDIRIVSEDNRLELTAETRPLPTITDLAPLFEGFDPLEFQDDVSVQFRLEMPGEVFVENADQTVDGRLVWEVPFSSRRVIMRAEGDATERRFPWWLAGATVAVCAGALFLVAIRSTSDEMERITGESGPDPAEREKVTVPEGFGGD